MPDRYSAMVAQPSFNTACMKLIDAARHAAQNIILPSFRSNTLTISQKSGPQDIVTDADQAAEDYLTSAARALFNNALIIGEEAAAMDPQIMLGIDDADISVIIDPIDGTWNYAHGVGTFGIAICVVVRGTTVFGLLYDPLMDDAVFAYLGRGAMFQPANSVPEKIRSKAGGAGFVPLTAFRPEKVEDVIAFGHSLSSIRSLHCSSHEYRLLAQGHASWSITVKNAMPWDHAAGALIHTEAGGITRFLDGEEYYSARNHGPLLSAPDEHTWHYIKQGLTNLI